MFGLTESQKNSFLEQTKNAREERALEKKRNNAAICIQSLIRGFLARKRFKQKILDDFDKIVTNFQSDNGDQTLSPNTEVFTVASCFLTLFQPSNLNQRDRFETLCRYVNKSVESESLKTNYASLCLQKNLSLQWIAHIKKLLNYCCQILDTLKPENHTDNVSLTLYLHTLIVFTSPKSWGLMHNKNMDKIQPALQKICCNIQGNLIQNSFFPSMRGIMLKGFARKELSLKPVSIKAIITLCTRPLIDGDFSESLVSKFLIEIFSIPALVVHLEDNAPQCVAQLQSMKILNRALEMSVTSNWLEDFVESSSGTKSLAFLGNLVHLFHIESANDSQESTYLQMTEVTTYILSRIPAIVGTRGALCHWHGLLGSINPSQDAAQNQNVPLLKQQFRMLWNHKCMKLLLGDVLKDINKNFERVEFQPPPPNSGCNLLRRALERSSTKSNLNKTGRQWRRLDSPEFFMVAKVCSMYFAALTALSQLKLDILSGICYNDTVLYDLWQLLTSVGPYCGIREFVELLKADPSCHQAQIYMLMLFADCMTHYVTILDEYEMYTEQKPFLLNDFVGLSYFLNNFLYKIIQENILDHKNLTTLPIFVSLHTLLQCLYRRDCRRPFAQPNHWLIQEIKPSHFLADLEKGKKYAQILLQKMPHVIPHEDRVKLFRRYVQNEKAVLGLTESACASPRSALIVIHRERIVEDGYRQLGLLRAHALKGLIRVRFINQQGLHEAGIDQDGVFKEFLEETITRVFDPSLNLFKTTSDERLYPSPISFVQDNHLQLFEFVGRMLGKAVYEGIVVDVPFASFFLSQLLGQTQHTHYSCLDELSSLDNELYRNLTFIKHYKQDVSELNLTFSVDQDVMGKIVTHELRPGGSRRAVTDLNKIIYIHYMAYFHMHTQIREQTAAFNRGFRSIVNPEWLSLFSAPELQRLISGDTVPLDLRDLRKHTQYYGGFHDSHRVVGWLWDILAKDFTEEERKLFLKFVTSCSKPPLLGFAHLEPPFSIRCVEVGDDEDTGDTIGSVIRGFFTIRKRDPLNRLPTSSTCFNLLKLPNYQKKSTLRDKLRYAVCSNTGFELS